MHTDFQPIQAKGGTPMPSEINIKVERSLKTLRELTLDKVRDAILNQYFKPGQRLIERNLCEELGVSRTVVREVLRHLETEGLVQSIPQQGPIVATLDTDTTRQIYELRSLLEGHAAAGSATRATPQHIEKMQANLRNIETAFNSQDYPSVIQETTAFYETMFHCAGDTVAWSIAKSLNARINRLRLITISSSGRGASAPAEMHALLNAIATGNPEAASQAARAHIQTAQAIAMQHIQSLV
jgi:DNA-binding GntR family transcriptional regulator